MAVYYDGSSSRNNVKYFLKNYHLFGKIKKISVFMDSINFLVMTDYELESSDVKFIAETHEGNIVQLASVNCGYGGTGPGALSDILIFLGVEKDYADRIRFFKGLEFRFDKEGNFLNGKTVHPIFGHDYNEKSQIHIKYCYADFAARKIYITNPEQIGFIAVLRMLEFQEAYRLDYWFNDEGKPEGIDSDILGALNRMYHGEKTSSGISDLSYLDSISCEIVGARFFLTLLIGEKSRIAYINSLVLFLIGEPLFYEKKQKDHITLSLIPKKDNIFKWVLKEFRNINKSSSYENEIKPYFAEHKINYKYCGSISIHNGEVRREVGECE